MGFQNLHTHTTYCDGLLAPEAMIKAALKKGCDSIGFSEHSYITFDDIYSMSPEITRDYVREINALKDKYKDEIEVFVGLEADHCTAWMPKELDYVIGAVHYLNAGDVFVSVDAGARDQKSMVDDYFGGDYYKMTEDYFEALVDAIKITNADIVGHFDLVAKYNFNGRLFDETHPRYISAALKSIDLIMENCKLFEVNTGAMYRFNKPEPYPTSFLLKEIRARGGEVILSSDSHDSESLCHKFEDMQEFLKTCGFDYIKRLTKDGFVDVKI